MFTVVTRVTIPDGIVRFTHALVENASLRSWFLSLEGLTTAMRRRALRQMAEQMRTERADSELADAASAMTHAEMYDAVRKSVRERCGV